MSKRVLHARTFQVGFIPYALLIGSVVVPGTARAQTSGPPQAPSAAAPQIPAEPAVNPGRPTVTDVASLTAPGYLEMESGLNYASGGYGLNYQFSQAILFKLTNRPGRPEFRLSTNGYVIQRTTGSSAVVTTGAPANPMIVAANTNSFAQGFGDTTLGVQQLLMVQTPHTYNLAARLEYKAPTAASGVGTGKSDYNLLLLASKDYTDQFHADYNLGQALLGRPDQSGFVQQFFASAAFSYQLPHGVTVQTEFYGFSGNALNGTNIVNGYGVTYSPRPAVVYDAYLGFGLTRAAPKYTLTVGRTFFLGKIF